MGKRGNKRHKRNKQSQRTREEFDLVKDTEMQRAEREDAERRAKQRADEERRARLSSKRLPARGGDPPPPIFGETDPLVRSPLKPKPHLRSGAIALPEPEPEDALLTVNPKWVSK
jgi:hypothetical protein